MERTQVGLPEESSSGNYVEDSFCSCLYNEVEAGYHRAPHSFPDLLMLQAYFQKHNLDLPVEVETRTLQEVREAIGLLERPDGGACIQRVMLDNMARADPTAEGEVWLVCGKPHCCVTMRSSSVLVACCTVCLEEQPHASPSAC